jgi:hypothetical protein
MNSLVERESITVAIDSNARRYASLFAAEQVSIIKGKQVYLNTLAVCALHHYLHWLSIDSSLAQSDCWQPNLRSIFNLADLVLPNLGCLECRIITGENDTLEIVRSPKDDCLGYAIVRLHKDLSNIDLLGFVSVDRVTDEVVTINSNYWQSLDTLLETIERHRRVNNLKQWLVDRFQLEWQQPELLLSNSGSYFRSLQDNKTVEEKQLRYISRGKTIIFNRDRIEIVLVMTIAEISVNEFEICLRVYPNKEDKYIPSKLRLEIWDELPQLSMEIEARERDSCLELKFNCSRNEEFSIKMIIGDMIAIERFIA